MSSYKFDENGLGTCYFGIALHLIFLIPMTFELIYSYIKEQLAEKKSLCYCQKCEKEREAIYRSKPNFIVRMFNDQKLMGILLGWFIVGFFCFMIYDQQDHVTTPKYWDPYEIIGVTESSSLAEIKSSYKKLSLIYHPDKAKAGFEKINEELFIDLTRAYKVLTDDTARKNFLEFGHPDGKQSFQAGVALPKSLIDGNGGYVLACYAVVFGLCLPYFISRWWSKSRRLTKDKILNKTMGGFIKELREEDQFKELVCILSGATEFKENMQTCLKDEKVLNVINGAIAEEMDSQVGDKYERLDDQTPAYRRKARTLIYAYLLRIDIAKKGANQSLVKDQKFIIDKSIHLIQGFMQIATVKQWLNVTCSMMELQQHLFQATFPGEPSIKQLPHINNALLRRYRKKNITSVQQLSAMSEDERRTFLKSLSDSDYLDVMEVAQRIPKLSVEKAEFKVIGDNVVTTGAIITFILKLRNGQIIDVEAKQEDQVKNEDDELFDEEDQEEKKNKKALPFAHTPYYTGEKKPYWWIFLGDPKVNRILVPHKKVTDIVDVQTVKIPFPGPPKPGVYTFSMFIKSDTYVGTDIVQDVQLKVHDPADLPPEEAVDDSISDPEEDSIAGQMKMMREQGLASALAGGSAGVRADSDSDSDEENEANYVTESDSD